MLLCSARPYFVHPTRTLAQFNLPVFSVLVFETYIHIYINLIYLFINCLINRYNLYFVIGREVAEGREQVLSVTSNICNIINSTNYVN